MIEKLEFFILKINFWGYMVDNDYNFGFLVWFFIFFLKYRISEYFGVGGMRVIFWIIKYIYIDKLIRYI